MLTEAASRPVPLARKERVAWVSHDFGYGGDLMYFGEIFRAFRAHFPNMLVCVDERQRFDNPYNLDLRAILRKWSIPLTRRTKEGALYPSQVAIPSPSFLWRLLRLRADAIIVIEFTPAAILGTIAAKVIGRAKLVLLVESDPVSRGASTNPLVLAVKRWVVRRADVIQTNNEAGLRYLTGLLRAPPGKVRVAPYLTSRPPGPQLCADRISGRQIRLLFANSLTERKGLIHALEALAMLSRETLSRFDLTIVGDGPESPALQSFVHDCGLAENVTFAGKKPYALLGQYYACADVLLVTSLADYRSLASFEGLGYGLAIIGSSADGACAETVQDEWNGFIVPAGDSLAIADRLRRIANDHETLARFKANSLSLYHDRFSLDRIAENVANVVGLALDQK